MRTVPSLVLLLGFTGTLVNGQTVSAATPSNPVTAVPEWQRLAGGTMSFEIASIHRGTPKTFRPPDIEVGPDDSFSPTGGRFQADLSVEACIEFAYKLWLTGDQERAMLARLPKWAKTDYFVIHARGPANATKDQMRLMMQSLLADRFKLAVHIETQEVPVLALVLENPGKLGPKLHHHEDGPACDVHSAAQAKNSQAGAEKIFPPICYIFAIGIPSQNNQSLEGSRNTTMTQFASFLASTHLDRIVVDQTGLTGRFDFTLRQPLEAESAWLPAAPIEPEAQAPALLKALKEQLGLKLIPTRAPVESLVIDHIERPSEN